MSSGLEEGSANAETLKTERAIVQEIGRSLVDAEIEKLTRLKRESIPDVLSGICSDLVQYLENKLSDAEDRFDLFVLRNDIDVIAELIRLFHATSQQRSSWWARPLLRECYSALNLDLSQRSVLIIHSDDVHAQDLNEFVVYPDLLSIVGSKYNTTQRGTIDVFQIPLEARHDLATIALVAHEVGHVYSHEHRNIIEDIIVDSEVAEILGGKDDLQESTATETDVDDDLFKQAERIAKQAAAAKQINQLARLIAEKTEEYVCDAIGRHLLGPAFDFSLIKHLIPYTDFGQPLSDDSSSHPPDVTRILGSWNSIKSTSASLKKDANKNDSSSFSRMRAAVNILADVWEPLIKDPVTHEPPKPIPPKEDVLAQKLSEALKQTEQVMQPYDISKLSGSWDKVTPEIDSFRPPFESTVSSGPPEIISPIESLLIAVLYYYGKDFRNENEYFRRSGQSEQDKIAFLRSTLISHLTYSISVYDFVKLSHSRYCGVNFPKEALEGTIWEMRSRKREGKPVPFVISPSINPKKQYGYNSVDLRLGPFFLVHKAPSYTHVQPAPSDSTGSSSAHIEDFYQEVFKAVGKTFILHPHQFVLGSTLEFASLPSDYYGLVLGRSTWGRLGLNIATATTVQAGYKGCLTLELRNLGETPLPLTVGARIAQLCLIGVPSDTTGAGYFVSGGKYIGPVRPEVPKIRDDADWELLEQFALQD